ncbi:Hypothetical predicted protein [Podarcis lilfordi]|uniref:Uncharacterized protein n=1 Tax=Podarcis lilfordi TaxID=74358 RepID=A0AA35PKX1_9SAUR|nr:Hypothetical predicted protein [Podarcis lilfordi]
MPLLRGGAWSCRERKHQPPPHPQLLPRAMGRRTGALPGWAALPAPREEGERAAPAAPLQPRGARTGAPSRARPPPALRKHLEDAAAPHEAPLSVAKGKRRRKPVRILRGTSVTHPDPRPPSFPKRHPAAAFAQPAREPSPRLAALSISSPGAPLWLQIGARKQEGSGRTPCCSGNNCTNNSNYLRVWRTSWGPQIRAPQRDRKPGVMQQLQKRRLGIWEHSDEETVTRRPSPVF